MSHAIELDRIAINVKSHRLLRRLMAENPWLEIIMQGARNQVEALEGVREWVRDSFGADSPALRYQADDHHDAAAYHALTWRDRAAIRVLDYIDHAELALPDANLRGELALSNPIKLIWLAVTHGTGGAKPWFFEDMLALFRQLRGEGEQARPGREQIETWMARWPTGLDPRMVELRRENRERILAILLGHIERGDIKHPRFTFDDGMSRDEKLARMRDWWQDSRFHLGFAARTPELLNELLGDSLDPDTLRLLDRARERGIPFFVNPYYLSLLHVRVPYFAVGADLAIRHYVLYSEQLVEEFGAIRAWEMEDLVEPGKPNAAGWLLPSASSVHRRYPDVAILIPDTQGRACGGLCASCQRMYDFQSGHLNFDLKALEPKERWPDKLKRLMDYFEQDSQLRDILITGGDALMSADRPLAQLLEAIAHMAERKRAANQDRAQGERYAEIQRVRLGTRLPVYLPQRITPELARILADFKQRGEAVGIRQFVIQTHFESPMEVTPEAKAAVARLLEAGWLVTNQLVCTVAASRRGHAAKLRQALNDIGVVPYYSFAVKGYHENAFNFAPLARLVQEENEEKRIGRLPDDAADSLRDLAQAGAELPRRLDALRRKHDLPFLASDRTVLNLPGVGKSLTFRVIGITRYGRRILEFDHDPTRAHSPIIERMGKVRIIESKAIAEYLEQLDALGEDPADYAGLYGWSLGETEPRAPLFEYPDLGFKPTAEMTNLELEPKP